MVWPGAAIFVFNATRWLFNKVPTLLVNVPIVPGTMFSVALYEHNHQRFSSLYIISNIICVVFEAVISATAVRMPDWPPQQLLLSNMAFILFVISISVLALRTMKYEAVQGASLHS